MSRYRGLLITGMVLILASAHLASGGPARAQGVDGMSFSYAGTADADGRSARLEFTIYDDGTVTGKLTADAVCESSVRLPSTNITLTGTVSGPWEKPGTVISGNWKGGDFGCDGGQMTGPEWPTNGVFQIETRKEMSSSGTVMSVWMTRCISEFGYTFKASGKSYTATGAGGPIMACGAGGGGSSGTGPVPTVVIDRDTGTGPLDLIFCIDLTGSMDDDIENVKAAASSIVDSVAAKNREYRVAILGYRDWDDSEGYAMFEDYPFSSDKSVIVRNINSLSVGGGDDTPEAVFEALMRAIESSALGGWRNNVNKQIILMGDAPPHNPSREGLTPQIVAKAAFDADPVVIQALVVGIEGTFDPDAVVSFKEIAELTGGRFFEAADAAAVPETLQESIAVISGPTPGVLGILGTLGTLVYVAICGVGLLIIILVVVFLLLRGKKKPRPVPVPVAAPVQPVHPVAPQEFRPVPPQPAYVPPPAPATQTSWTDETIVPMSQRTAVLMVRQGLQAGQNHPLDSNTRIGRAPDNEIVLSSPQVSRYHAVIHTEGASYIITDMGAANGVIVNGVRIAQRHTLRAGDVITLGGEEMVFQY